MWRVPVLKTSPWAFQILRWSLAGKWSATVSRDASWEFKGPAPQQSNTLVHLEVAASTTADNLDNGSPLNNNQRGMFGASVAVFDDFPLLAFAGLLGGETNATWATRTTWDGVGGGVAEEDTLLNGGGKDNESLIVQIGRNLVDPDAPIPQTLAEWAYYRCATVNGVTVSWAVQT
jgi:hypothetical protein